MYGLFICCGADVEVRIRWDAETFTKDGPWSMRPAFQTSNRDEQPKSYAEFRIYAGSGTQREKGLGKMFYTTDAIELVRI